MLLIAQPKSASTSLTKTLSQLMKVHDSLGVAKNKNNVNCEEFQEIQKFHNNMIKRNDQFIKTVMKSKVTLFKEHLLPTKEHLELLNKYKQNIVILLREPEHSLDSYIRFFKKNKRKSYNEEKILNDLRLFHDRYMWWASNKRYAIVIYYKDLINNYNNTMKKILKHYKCDIKKTIPLKKLKYTGIGEKRVTNSST